MNRLETAPVDLSALSIDDLLNEIKRRTMAAPRWMTLKEAARYVGCHEDSMRKYAERFGIGAKLGDKWQIDRNRLDALLERRSFDPIPAPPPPE